MYPAKSCGTLPPRPTLWLPLINLFFFKDPATTEIYTLSLHDALPISRYGRILDHRVRPARTGLDHHRSEEHTSELQSQSNLVCRLLLEKKNAGFVSSELLRWGGRYATPWLKAR